jgi:hypothetical protein
MKSNNSIISSTGITTVMDAIASLFPQHNIDVLFSSSFLDLLTTVEENNYK